MNVRCISCGTLFITFYPPLEPVLHTHRSHSKPLLTTYVVVHHWAQCEQVECTETIVTKKSLIEIAIINNISIQQFTLQYTQWSVNRNAAAKQIAYQFCARDRENGYPGKICQTNCLEELWALSGEAQLKICWCNPESSLNTIYCIRNDRRCVKSDAIPYLLTYSLKTGWLFLKTCT